MLFNHNGWIGAGAAIIFFPPLASMMLFGKTRGMEAAFYLGVNISFSLIAIAAVVGFFAVGYNVVRIYLEARRINNK